MVNRHVPYSAMLQFMQPTTWRHIAHYPWLVCHSVTVWWMHILLDAIQPTVLNILEVIQCMTYLYNIITIRIICLHKITYCIPQRVLHLCPTGAVVGAIRFSTFHCLPYISTTSIIDEAFLVCNRRIYLPAWILSKAFEGSTIHRQPSVFLLSSWRPCSSQIHRTWSSKCSVKMSMVSSCNSSG